VIPKDLQLRRRSPPRKAGDALETANRRAFEETDGVPDDHGVAEAERFGVACRYDILSGGRCLFGLAKQAGIRRFYTKQFRFGAGQLNETGQSGIGRDHGQARFRHPRRQNEWPKAAENIVNYREIALSVGHNPPPPIILTNVSCAESRDEAHDRAMNWLGKKWESIDNHYHFSDGHLATVKGYETYGKMAKTYARLQSEEERVRATEFYVKIQIVGTPEDCIQQIAELQRVTGTDHVVTEFSYGGIPHDVAEKNMRLFASRVLPVLQSDSAFATPPVPAMAPKGTTKNDIFAPA